MRRRLVVTYRESSYLLPAAQLLISLLREAGRLGHPLAAANGHPLSHSPPGWAATAWRHRID